jgi:CBS domain-containing protein
MTPQEIAGALRREVPLLREDDSLRHAVSQFLEAGVPALPVVDAHGRLLGIFGEREFIGALFPGYLKTLGYAGFVRRTLDEALEKRSTCADEPVAKHLNTDHIDVSEEFSDIELAEIFLHHRVLIVPIVDAGRVSGIITRADYTKALAHRILMP